MSPDTEIGHRILQILYEDHFGGGERNSSVEDLADDLEGVDADQVRQVLGNLAAAGLVGTPGGIPKLTADGIEFALNDVERRRRREDREERRRYRMREHRINKSVLGLTLALVLAGGLQAIALNLDYYPPLHRLNISILGAAAIAVAMTAFLAYLHWFDG